MPSCTVTVINPLGLHARAAAQVVRLAGGYKSRITICRFGSDVRADARSILSLLTLSASMGSEVTIDAAGDDQDEALEAICGLFERGFGEI